MNEQKPIFLSSNIEYEDLDIVKQLRLKIKDLSVSLDLAEKRYEFINFELYKKELELDEYKKLIIKPKINEYNNDDNEYLSKPLEMLHIINKQSNEINELKYELSMIDDHNNPIMKNENDSMNNHVNESVEQTDKNLIIYLQNQLQDTIQQQIHSDNELLELKQQYNIVQKKSNDFETYQKNLIFHVQAQLDKNKELNQLLLKKQQENESLTKQIINLYDDLKIATKEIEEAYEKGTAGTIIELHHQLDEERMEYTKTIQELEKKLSNKNVSVLNKINNKLQDDLRKKESEWEELLSEYNHKIEIIEKSHQENKELRDDLEFYRIQFDCGEIARPIYEKKEIEGDETYKYYDIKNIIDRGNGSPTTSESIESVDHHIAEKMKHIKMLGSSAVVKTGSSTNGNGTMTRRSSIGIRKNPPVVVTPTQPVISTVTPTATRLSPIPMQINPTPSSSRYNHRGELMIFSSSSEKIVKKENWK